MTSPSMRPINSGLAGYCLFCVPSGAIVIGHCYIFSGAVTPKRPSPFRMTWRVAPISASRACFILSSATKIVSCIVIAMEFPGEIFQMVSNKVGARSAAASGDDTRVIVHASRDPFRRRSIRGRGLTLASASASPPHYQTRADASVGILQVVDRIVLRCERARSISKSIASRPCASRKNSAPRRVPLRRSVRTVT